MIRIAQSREKKSAKFVDFRRESLPDAVEKHLRAAIMRGAYRTGVPPANAT